MDLILQVAPKDSMNVRIVDEILCLLFYRQTTGSRHPTPTGNLRANRKVHREDLTHDKNHGGAETETHQQLHHGAKIRGGDPAARGIGKGRGEKVMVGVKGK